MTNKLSALKKAILFSVLLACTSVLMAQSNYNLLWQIDHPEMDEPSYLFGTIHVKDSRAFNFSDSVLIALKATQSFALEVHPDSIISGLFKEMSNKDTSSFLLETLDEDEFDRLDFKFKKNKGFSLKQVKTKNPFVIKQFLTPERQKKDDKATFVDAHLLSMAKTLGHDIVGLEQMSDQLEHYYSNNKLERKQQIRQLFENLDSDENYWNQLDRLINIYSKGNIYDISSALGPGLTFDPIMIKRNKVMLASLKDLMAKGSLFAAVGVGHLPGDNGLIELLKKEGYSLRPVGATFTGVTNQFNVDYSKFEWYPYEDETKGYRIEMPGMPIPADLFIGLEAILSVDIISGGTYGVFSVPVGESQDQGLSLMNKVLDFYKRNQVYSKINSKDLEIDDLLVMEVNMTVYNTRPVKMRMMVRNSILYCMYVESNSGFKNIDLERFFNSLEVFTPTSISKDDWITLNDDKGAFSVKLPVEPKFFSQKTQNPEDIEAPYHLNLYVSTDVSGGANYLVRYNDYPLGYYMGDTTEFYKAIEENFSLQGSVLSGPKYLEVDGNPAREYEVMLNDASYGKTRIIIRGNRTYLIIHQSLVEGNRSLDDDVFLNTFKLEPYLQEEYEIFEAADSTFSIMLYPDYQLQYDTSIYNYDYWSTGKSVYMTNPNTGGLHLFDQLKLKEYFWKPNLDSLYIDLVEASIGWDDSVLTQKPIQIGDIDGFQVEYYNTGSTAERFLTYWYDKGYLYSINSFLSAEESEASLKQIFDSFKSTSTNDLDIFKSKTDQLLTALMSEDSAQSATARSAINYYDFYEEDLPLIYNALQKEYPDDTSSVSRRAMLVGQLEYVNDSTTVEVLKACYENAGEFKELQRNILETMMSIGNDTLIGYYTDRILSDSLFSDFNYYLFSPYRDSIPYFVSRMDDFIDLMGTESVRGNILSLMVDLAEDSAYSYLVENRLQDIFQYRNQDLKSFMSEFAKDPGAYSAELAHYFNILSEISGNDLTESFTLKFMNPEMDNWYFNRALATRLKKDLEVDSKLVKQKLKDKETRFGVMRVFSNADKQSQIPSKYKKTEEFAELSVIDYAESDYSKPDDLKMLGVIKKETEDYYVYGMKWDDEEDSYLAVCKPLNGSKLNFGFNVASDWDYVTDSWKSDAERLIEYFEED